MSWENAWSSLPNALSAFEQGQLHQANQPDAVASALVHGTGERWLTIGFQLFSELHSDNDQAWLLVSFPSAGADRQRSMLMELGNVLASRLAMGMEATAITLSPPVELKPNRWRQILHSAGKISQQMYRLEQEGKHTPMQLTLLTQLKSARADGIREGNA